MFIMKIEIEFIPISEGHPPFLEEVFIKYKRLCKYPKEPQITVGHLIKIDHCGADWFVYNQHHCKNEIIGWCSKPNVC